MQKTISIMSSLLLDFLYFNFERRNLFIQDVHVYSDRLYAKYGIYSPKEAMAANKSLNNIMSISFYYTSILNKDWDYTV